jgi:hypothetical protein
MGRCNKSVLLLLLYVVQQSDINILLVNANASNALNDAIASSNSSYDGSLAVTIWTNEARNSNA